MKRFFALPALLRSTALLVTASQHAFSVQDDILAFPQYDVRFDKQEWLSEEEALSKLARNARQQVHDTDALQDSPLSQVEQYQRPLGTSGGHDGSEIDQFDYEEMVLDGQKWLCQIPKVKKPTETVGVNNTLTKADEEKELARATDRGWELLSGMEDNCVFFISGWWSYRFCYNEGVKQFHQLPPSRGVPVYPPVEDPGVPGFMLGTYDKRFEDEDPQKDSWEEESALDKSEGTRRTRSGHGELVQRGESRYLVQKLGGGTVCDLTGKERKVEVQFHCNPQYADRISLIKETSTCHYLMVIQTPRLCNDVAFQPPQKDQPNSVSCSRILREHEVEDYERELKALNAAQLDNRLRKATAEAAAAMGVPAIENSLPVGDIFVGGHRFVPEGQTIEKSAIVGGGKETYIDTVASSDGKVLPKEQLEKLGLGDPKAVDDLKKKLEKIAQGQHWKLDVIDTPRGREYRGIIGDEEDDKHDDGKETKEKKAKGGEESAKSGKKKKKTHEKKTEQRDKKQPGSEEEYYHEEL